MLGFTVMFCLILLALWLGVQMLVKQSPVHAGAASRSYCNDQVKLVYKFAQC